LFTAINIFNGKGEALVEWKSGSDCRRIVTVDNVHETKATIPKSVQIHPHWTCRQVDKNNVLWFLFSRTL